MGLSWKLQKNSMAFYICFYICFSSSTPLSCYQCLQKESSLNNSNDTDNHDLIFMAIDTWHHFWSPISWGCPRISESRLHCWWSTTTSWYYTDIDGTRWPVLTDFATAVSHDPGTLPMVREPGVIQGASFGNTKKQQRVIYPLVN